MELPQNPRLVFGLIVGVVVVSVLTIGVGRFTAPNLEITPSNKAEASLTQTETGELSIPKLTIDPFQFREPSHNPDPSEESILSNMENPAGTPPIESPTTTVPSFPRPTNARPVGQLPTQTPPFDPREISGAIPSEPNISPLPGQESPTYSDFPDMSQTAQNPADQSQLLPGYNSSPPSGSNPPEAPKNPKSIRLTAIIISKTPTAYISVGGNSAESYKEGDTIKPGVKVIKITQESVTLQLTGKSAILSVGKDGVLP